MTDGPEVLDALALDRVGGKGEVRVDGCADPVAVADGVDAVLRMLRGLARAGRHGGWME
jgi:hypothetical protein